MAKEAMFTMKLEPVLNSWRLLSLSIDLPVRF